jgi:hypothetical protein
MIHWMYDSSSGHNIPMAIFRASQKNHAVDARYIFREWKEGDKVEVIFEKDDPSKGAVYRLWGYWLKWEEILGSLVVLIVLFQVAVAITKNPTPEAVMDQLEVKEEKKRRYME